MVNIFRALGVIGIITIDILSFTIPSNPYEIIPAMTMITSDKPLWLCYFMTGSFTYIILLYYLYEHVKEY